MYIRKFEDKEQRKNLIQFCKVTQSTVQIGDLDDLSIRNTGVYWVDVCRTSKTCNTGILLFLIMWSSKSLFHIIFINIFVITLGRSLTNNHPHRGSEFESDGGNNITGGMNSLGGGEANKAIGI